MFSIHMYVCIDILCVRKSSCNICICTSNIKYVTYMYTVSMYVCRYIYIYMYVRMYVRILNIYIPLYLFLVYLCKYVCTYLQTYYKVCILSLAVVLSLLNYILARGPPSVKCIFFCHFQFIKCPAKMLDYLLINLSVTYVQVV